MQHKIFTEMDLPINVARVLHRDQKLKFHRPIRVGDRLYFDSYLDSVLESHGMVTAEVRAEVTDENGDPVATSIVTMIGEAEGHERDAAAMAANIASHRKN
ncbi:MaoC-like dehydratase [Mycobacteroides abscessus subsp. abscessus]|nr:MaoC-like dehydratase [Mycobacteroides abscessus subsp. abscessus]SIK72624.1 MaoC-like dehydratase [Mycobacteroides abscessus subsp. abscessus]SIM82798.1 MaoC-like dehydratase [Mycobacteroides abscessus subsp. abscessus]